MMLLHVKPPAAKSDKSSGGCSPAERPLSRPGSAVAGAGRDRRRVVGKARGSVRAPRAIDGVARREEVNGEQSVRAGRGAGHGGPATAGKPLDLDLDGS